MSSSCFSTLEFLTCGKCNDIVFDNHKSICCDICNCWYHFKCSSLRNADFLSYCENIDKKWFCPSCTKGSLPFQSLSDKQFGKCVGTIPQTEFTSNIFSFTKNCSVCSGRSNDIQNSIPCVTCESLIHVRCSRFQPRSALTCNVLREWSCSSCCLQLFPFSPLDYHELMRLLFTSNVLCACQNDTIDSCDKRTREKLDLCKLSIKEHDELYINDIDQHLTLQSNFNYYELHDFHNLIAKNLSMCHVQ